MCKVSLLVAERSPDGSRCLWSPLRHHWQIGCGECSPSEDIHISKIKEINRADRCGADVAAGSLTKSMVFLLFVSASCPEIKASHFSLSAAGNSVRHNHTHAHADVHVDHVLFCWGHVKLLLIVKSTSVNSELVAYTQQLITQVQKNTKMAQQIKCSQNHHWGFFRLVTTIMMIQNSESADMRIHQKFPVGSVFRWDPCHSYEL